MLALSIGALLAAPVAHAQGDYKQLRKDVAELVTRLNDSETKLSEANQKLNANLAAQDAAKNDPTKVAQLKKEGVALRATANTAQDNRDSARSNLASKQGDLRAAASKWAVDQLTAAGNLNARVVEVRHAFDAWNEALGTLPEVPAVRPITADMDPEVKNATIAGDRARLKAFDAWASGEEDRLKTELDRAEKLIGAEAQVKGTDDGPDMVKEAKALKDTLKTRQTKVAELRRKAAEALKNLK